VTEHDALRSRFDAFRDRSVGAAVPPPVDEIPRRLRRRNRRRTAGALLAAAALVALVAVPSWRDRSTPPLPATSPTPRPSPSASPPASAEVVIGAPASVPSSASTGPSKSPAGCGIDAHGLPVMPNGAEGYAAYNDARTAMIPVPGNLFTVCPAARVTYVHAYYTWDIARKQLVAGQVESHTLTRGQPSGPYPASIGLSGSCGSVEALLYTGKPVPSAIPRSVQDRPDYGTALDEFFGTTATVQSVNAGFEPYDKTLSHPWCTTASPTG